MALNFEIVYRDLVVNLDIPGLAPAWREKVRDAIEEKLTTSPEFFGRPLRHSLKGYRKLRVGDYRVVFRIHNDMVLIFGILHRSIVYREMRKRV